MLVGSFLTRGLNEGKFCFQTASGWGKLWDVWLDDWGAFCLLALSRAIASTQRSHSQIAALCTTHSTTHFRKGETTLLWTLSLAFLSSPKISRRKLSFTRAVWLASANQLVFLSCCWPVSFHSIYPLGMLPVTGKQLGNDVEQEQVFYFKWVNTTYECLKENKLKHERSKTT